MNVIGLSVTSGSKPISTKYSRAALYVSVELYSLFRCKLTLVKLTQRQNSFHCLLLNLSFLSEPL